MSKSISRYGLLEVSRVSKNEQLAEELQKNKSPYEI